MYTTYFRLSEAPFQLISDHRYFFGKMVHARSLDCLSRGLVFPEGIIVLTGDTGVGKTTLISHFLTTLDPSKYIFAAPIGTQLESEDTLRAIAVIFGRAHERQPRAAVLRDIRDHLRRISASGLVVLLIVDEAQILSDSVLEFLRVLAEFDYRGQACLRLLLVGHTQFRERIASPALAKLRQAVVANTHLGPLTLDDTQGYIRHRLSYAGWQNDPVIADEAMAMVHDVSEGIPRIINLIFNRVIMLAFIDKLHLIDANLTLQVIQTLRMEFDWGHLPTSTRLEQERC